MIVIDGYVIAYLKGKALRSVPYGAAPWNGVVSLVGWSACTAFLNARSRRTVGCVFEP